MRRVNLSTELLQSSNLDIPFKAGLMCTNNFDKSNDFEKNKFLLNMVNEKHYSVIEHLSYSFVVRNISRALLQELARHRLVSLSVLSTRWALKKITKDIEVHYPVYVPATVQQTKILNELDAISEKLFNLIGEAAASGMPNDILKYYIQESLCTSLVLTVNARELIHIFELRTSKRALKEFRILCHSLFNSLPEDHKFLFEKFLEKDLS
ncbi:MAG: FAD-dependent thymidylate synthase [Spirochaetia bacterium]|nr:FAD-dependent thymidylate synthase [Spirochaetia bacterium]